MNEEKQTLEAIAKKLSISLDNLRAYLYEELPLIKQAVVIDSRINLIMQEMTRDGAGVYFCLIEKADTVAPRPRTISDFIGKMLEGAYQVSSSCGYSLRHYTIHEKLATPDYFRHIFNKHPEAGILALIPQRAETIAAVSVELKRHCLMLDYQLDDALPVHTLNIDNFSAIQDITNKLIELGHKNIAFIGGIPHFASAKERLAGYKAALAGANIPFRSEYVADSLWSINTGNDAAKAFFELENPPTAIICSNDQTALGTYGAAKEYGLTIPYDVSVTGFDDIPIVANITPPLTTVRQSLTELGQRAVELLIDIMDGGLKNEFQHNHPLEIIMRGSITQPPR